MNRNHKRVLSEDQIESISKQVALDLMEYAQETADTLVDHYLRDDAEGLMVLVSSWIESAEDTIIDQLNHDLNEDSFNNDQFIPHYGF